MNIHPELIGAIAFTMVLAVLYEGLKTLREYLMCVALQKDKKKNNKKEKEEKTELAMAEKGKNTDCPCPCQASNGYCDCNVTKARW